MRAWHFLSVVNLLVAAVTLAAVIAFRLLPAPPVPVQVTVERPKPPAQRPKFEYARFKYRITDKPHEVAVELVWTDREGIRLAESMGKLINQLAKKERIAADATVSMEDLLNFAGDMGWDVVHVQYQSGLGDSPETTVSLVEVYFKRVL